MLACPLFDKFGDSDEVSKSTGASAVTEMKVYVKCIYDEGKNAEIKGAKIISRVLLC